MHKTGQKFGHKKKELVRPTFKTKNYIINECLNTSQISLSIPLPPKEGVSTIWPMIFTQAQLLSSRSNENSLQWGWHHPSSSVIYFWTLAVCSAAAVLTIQMTRTHWLERCKQFSLVSSCHFTIDAREALQNYLRFIMFRFPDSYVY